MFSEALKKQARQLLRACEKQKVKLATAESCTGGLIAALLTEIPGSSAVFDRGFVTYSNESKNKLLGVPTETLRRHGAVSSEVVLRMAAGALTKSNAQLSIAVSGVAGPGGGTKTKPVGLVYIACGVKEHAVSQEYHFKGGRTAVRLAAVSAALSMAKALSDRCA